MLSPPIPCPRSTVAIISTVEVLPLEPVTAMMWGGSCTRLKMSGQIFRANLPGIELPLPTSLPTNRPSLQTTIAKNFRMNILLSAFIFQPDHQRRQVGGAGAGFLALAVMIFGQWKPFNICAAAMFFAVFKSLANIADSTFLAQLHWSSNIYNMMPFIASMIILAFTSKNSMAPKAEGIPYDKGSR